MLGLSESYVRELRTNKRLRSPGRKARLSPYPTHQASGDWRRCGSWEAYACRAPATWLRHDLPFIRSQCPNGGCRMPVESEAFQKSERDSPCDSSGG